MNFTQLAAKKINDGKCIDAEKLQIGQKVTIIEGTGVFAACIPSVEHIIIKINRKTVKTESGKTFQKNQIIKIS